MSGPVDRPGDATPERGDLHGHGVVVDDRGAVDQSRAGWGVGAAPRISDDRGQSELVGVVLLLAIVLIGATVIALTGSNAVAEHRNTVATAEAAATLSEFDARSSEVLLGVGDDVTQSVAVRLPGSVDRLRTTDGSWMRVQVRNASTGAIDATVVNASLGALVYERDRTTVAYEGGGVWRADGAGAVVLSPPEFRFVGDTLTLPILGLSGGRSVAGALTVARDGPVERVHPDAARGLTNHVEAGTVAVTVHSDYYDAWGQYFRDSTDGIVEVDHAGATATVTFLSLPRTLHLRGGIIATAGSGELKVEGNGALTDSYDSRVGPYDPENASPNGTIEAVGDVSMGGGAHVHGDIKSGSVVDLDGNASVSGRVYWTDSFTASNNVNYGGETEIDGVPSITPIDGYVYENVDRIRTDNDNDNTSLIANDRLSIPSGGGRTTPELGPGTYYLTDLTLEKDDLALNATGGNISIAVRDHVVVDDRSSLTVLGDRNVRVFVAGENDTQFKITGGGRTTFDKRVNLGVGKKSEVIVPGDESMRLVIYGTQSFTAAIVGSGNNPPDVTGVIYAPAGEDGAGAAHVMHGQLKGAIVTGSLTVGSKGQVHYDEAIEAFALPHSPTISRIEYLHAAVHRIRVTDD